MRNAGAVHAGRVGRRRDEVVPRPDRRRLVGPAAAARGRRAHVRRARREHRLVRRRRRGSAREELVHGRGRRREGAPLADERAARDRRRLRRLPRHALIERGAPGSRRHSAAWPTCTSARGRAIPRRRSARLTARLGLAPGRTVVDLAAGTGKLTRLLVASGARVIAVEPLAEMRVCWRAAVPSAEVVDGTAESMPLAGCERRRGDGRAGVPLVRRSARRWRRSHEWCGPAARRRWCGTSAISRTRSRRASRSCCCRIAETRRTSTSGRGSPTSRRPPSFGPIEEWSCSVGRAPHARRAGGPVRVGQLRGSAARRRAAGSPGADRRGGRGARRAVRVPLPDGRLRVSPVS